MINTLGANLDPSVKERLGLVADDSQERAIEVSQEVKEQKPANQNKKFFSKEEFNYCYEFLCKRFPKLFKEGEVKVFKYKIHEDLWNSGIIDEDEKITKAGITLFLRGYCNKAKYLKTLKKQPMRYDLEGNEIIQVTEEEAQIAKETYNKRYSK